MKYYRVELPEDEMKFYEAEDDFHIMCVADEMHGKDGWIEIYEINPQSWDIIRFVV